MVARGRVPVGLVARVVPVASAPAPAVRAVLAPPTPAHRVAPAAPVSPVRALAVPELRAAQVSAVPVARVVPAAPG
ncbi:hypothetical protein SAMN05428938_4608 [Streptomyces sp. KS_5]|nr:hypothetical protein SAMN05216482_3475 [Streptomyces sp. PAN_FS17]SED33009.1 hypothetical protein SAMN05428938_4608 [Streptomyces sp. KS_5]